MFFSQFNRINVLHGSCFSQPEEDPEVFAYKHETGLSIKHLSIE